MPVLPTPLSFDCCGRPANHGRFSPGAANQLPPCTLRRPARLRRAPGSVPPFEFCTDPSAHRIAFLRARVHRFCAGKGLLAPGLLGAQDSGARRLRCIAAGFSNAV
ncbi:hypothetical protein Rsub_11522 [Raphidocelis subcapitata]|uniref:Uncharacterized protein n=1 Tax=Raphidocelis subcapitata TaxID=307507 RepID=A0A2V0PGA9_9CHLO|nr:hypothetical protein Rsub_11522 [Raphidocelis subcapitata]|eukprot:GBF98884.1 hypothetical protein Rsub_11522 [Raphidocelis subcapitata]